MYIQDPWTRQDRTEAPEGHCKLVPSNSTSCVLAGPVLPAFSQASRLSDNSSQHLVSLSWVQGTQVQLWSPKRKGEPLCAALTLWLTEGSEQHIFAKVPTWPCQQSVNPPGWSYLLVPESVDWPSQQRRQDTPPGPRTSDCILIRTFLWVYPQPSRPGSAPRNGEWLIYVK